MKAFCSSARYLPFGLFNLFFIFYP